MQRPVHAVCALLSVLSQLSALPLLSPMLSLQKNSFTPAAKGANKCYSVLKMSTFDSDEGGDDVIGAPVGPLPSVSRYS